MAATSSFNLAGLLKIVTARKENEISLSQILAEVEAKGYEVLIPAGGVLTAVPMPFSGGVTEALVVALYAPKKLTLRITSADGSHPGPMELGIKGWWFVTLNPGAGITAISASNASSTSNVTLEVYFGAKQSAGDPDPSYWTD